MAGGELWGVWVQTYTDDISPENAEKYGEIEDMAQAYRDGFAKDFCDGQTSPTPPRWPDDNMQLIYTYSREGAEMLQQYLRGDIAERIERGEITGTLPAWIGDISSVGLSSAAAVAVAEDVIAMGELDLSVGQVQARMADYIAATGDRRPTAERLLRWLRESGRDA